MKRELKDRLKAKYPTVFGVATGWEVGDGWHEILDALGAQLSRLKQIAVLTEIREKHGFLDLSYRSASVEAEALINAASDASERVCELCSEPGMIDPAASWLRTRCTTCRAMDRPAVGGVH